ncbi:quinone-dependent dihydroorotate dehydrogenase [Alicyclobacillus mengziensis]|uniref:Dihydroorotate dehydrogenase (quinone) n=1 Tax=Alicyclobacillus mengziensis TaxID=2931921 RepID=A0A9X7W1L0_9BACL|nr:quinone-dependent dihydroorotate dehydrogenase [Alicyclobacillus mengziensis]QSO49078.1 quinone-dependent dihydroorotate dehydrogenase [Alicyclobacillus mengziensis]
MYRWIRPLLFQMNPETAHKLTLTTLSRIPSVSSFFGQAKADSALLSQSLWGLRFQHPIGLAAGLDKNGEAVDAFLKLGFAFIEVGTVTPLPQPGNPEPRLFRLVDDRALINRMGFNNEGAIKLHERLAKRHISGIVGVNLGKNKVTDNDRAVDDYIQLVRELYSVADFFVINVSSPNTPGLRDLQAADTLIPLVDAVLKERGRQNALQGGPLKSHHANEQSGALTGRQTNLGGRARGALPPVLVKLAPDLDDEAIVDVAKRLVDVGVDGFIATNTTITRPSLQSQHRAETGGLSGKPLKERSTDVVSLVYRATEGRVPVIASGGVFTAADAFEKITAGASLVELYTALIYKGPEVIEEIVNGLQSLLQAEGFHSIKEAIGALHRT